MKKYQNIISFLVLFSVCSCAQKFNSMYDQKAQELHIVFKNEKMIPGRFLADYSFYVDCFGEQNIDLDMNNLLHSQFILMNQNGEYRFLCKKRKLEFYCSLDTLKFNSVPIGVNFHDCENDKKMKDLIFKINPYDIRVTSKDKKVRICFYDELEKKMYKSNWIKLSFPDTKPYLPTVYKDILKCPEDAVNWVNE